MGFRPTPPTSKSLQSQRKRRRSPAEDTATPTEEALVCDHVADLNAGMSLIMIRNAYLCPGDLGKLLRELRKVTSEH